MTCPCFKSFRLVAVPFLVFLAAVRACAADADADPTKQTDADWVDSRWQQTDIGPFLGAAIDLPWGKIPKAIAIKVGERDEGTLCFDTDLLRVTAGWTGGFLLLDPRRYGLIVAPKPAGSIQFGLRAGPGWGKNGQVSDPRSQRYGPLPEDWGRYDGLYLSGKRVVLSYNLSDVHVLESPWVEHHGEITAFTRALQLHSITPGTSPTNLLRICDLPASVGSLTNLAGTQIALLRKGDELTAVGTRSIPEAGFRVDSNNSISLALHGIPAKPLKIFIWSGPESKLNQFAELIQTNPPPENLSAWIHGGPPRWTAPLVTTGAIDQGTSPLAIDTLPLPEENPWKALLFTSAHDFFQNGDAAISTAHGDVWLASGLDQSLRQIKWKRFATGLYQPLGLKIIRDTVYVLERDQITVLRDLNGDREADFYENFNNQTISAGGGHSYATCLETDSAGNFYFLKCAENTPHGGSLLRVSADGKKLDVAATGFRNPNGLGIGPGNLITVADQQGEWVPETRLDLIQPGGFYGYMPMHHRSSPPQEYDRPLCWIPRAVDNSAGGQIWLPKEKWGPLGGQMLHLSYGRCALVLTLLDRANQNAQAAVLALPGRFLSGIMRARLHPIDGALYLTGLRGWQTAAVRDGCFQRARWRGSDFALPTHFTLRSNGVELAFSTPLDKETAEDVESYSAEQWNYRWSSQYGSSDYSAADPTRIGRDPVQIKRATLAASGKTLFIELPPLQPVMQFKLAYQLESANGKAFRQDLYWTVNQVKKKAP